MLLCAVIDASITSVTPDMQSSILHARLQPAGTQTKCSLCPHLQHGLLRKRNCTQAHNVAKCVRQIKLIRDAGSSHHRQAHAGRVKCSSVQTDDRTAETGALPQLPALDGSYQDTTRFAPYANWLIPGHLMVGRYPYVEPSRCPSREKGEEQVRKIVEAGITTFVCLQEELPAQNKMKVGGHNGFLPYMAVANGIAGSLSGPSRAAEMDGLRNPHVNKFLPPKRNGEKSKQKQLSFVFDPIVDLNLPDREQMLALVEQLKGFITGGEVVYMHCWGGRGRAGTIASCFLASCYNLTSEETADRIQLAFDTRNDGGRRSPETEGQREFVKEFIDSLREKDQLP